MPQKSLDARFGHGVATGDTLTAAPRHYLAAAVENRHGTVRRQKWHTPD
jgi:hypothetical protein